MPFKRILVDVALGSVANPSTLVRPKTKFFKQFKQKKLDESVENLINVLFQQ